MKIRVLFFGLIHDLTGLREELVDAPDGESIEGLRRRYEARFPRLGGLRGSVLLAVNEEVVDPSTLLQEGDEIAFMPPVSGGMDEDICQITREPIHASELAQSLKRGRDGAVVTFEGTVREQSHERKTRYLEYEAYERMAIRKMEEISAEARHKFDIHNVGIIHRIGRLEVGEVSVVIVVTAAHRRAAFEACHYAIDQLKQTVPIWKKEFFEDGAVWAEGEGQRRVLVEAKNSPALDEAVGA